MMNKLYLFETFHSRISSRKSGQALKLLVQAYADALRDEEASLHSLGKVERWIDQLLLVRPECLCDVGKSDIINAAKLFVRKRTILDFIHQKYQEADFTTFLAEWGGYPLSDLWELDEAPCHFILAEQMFGKSRELLIHHYLRVLKKRLQEAFRCLLFPAHKDGSPNEFVGVTTDNFALALAKYKSICWDISNIVYSTEGTNLTDDEYEGLILPITDHQEDLLRYVAKFAGHSTDDDDSKSVIEEVCESLEELDSDLSMILDDLSSEFLAHHEKL
jgi:hypothetical protein